MTHHAIHRDSQMQACIDACTECHAVCLETMNYCLSQGGQHAAPEHIALLSACADICATSADAMLTGASVSPVICGTCAERSEEHTSELQSLMRISYGIFCL